MKQYIYEINYIFIHLLVDCSPTKKESIAPSFGWDDGQVPWSFKCSKRSVTDWQAPITILLY